MLRQGSSRIEPVSGVCVRYMCDIILLIIEISYVINLKGQIIELLHPTSLIYIYIYIQSEGENNYERPTQKLASNETHTKIIIPILNRAR